MQFLIRRRPRTAAFAAVALIASLTVAVSAAPPARAAEPCRAPGVNLIACENAKAGTPQSQWDVAGGGDASIVGFSSDFSVNLGQTVDFKINTAVSTYTIDIYRMGYYGGNGARKVASVAPSVALPQSQPACLSEASTGLVDCGNWAVSASWTVPADGVSGVYFARLTRSDIGVANHIVFVVRDDDSRSDLLVQTADTTWQAYNTYGGNSFYRGAPANRAYKVSYNRPFNTRTGSKRDFVWSAEFPMIRFLERNGYDVSYTSGIDTDRRGALLRNHKTFMSLGHDEYWSGAQRTNVEAARDAGVNLTFFSGNEVYWRTRWETSIDGTGTPYRTLVSYKETLSSKQLDPSAEWTGTFRDPRWTPPNVGGGQPENALTGQLFKANCCVTPTWQLRVPADDGKMRLWRNTSIASQAADGLANLPKGTLGYEWDEDTDNGFRPAGSIRLSSTTEDVSQYLLDYGSKTGPRQATHHLTMHRAPSGALVFGAGTVQWAWGLDATHDNQSFATNEPAHAGMQQATVNLFADMGMQPATLMPGLTAAAMSTDYTRPTSAITSPAAGSNLSAGTIATLTGTAADTGGKVGGVEVSTDGGATWHPATTGRSNWTYSWFVSGHGSVDIKTRAADDSGNIEVPGAGRNVTVDCPCTMFGRTVPGFDTEGVDATTDSKAVEVGTKFRAAVDGLATGVRFYKGSANTGTHVGNLWTTTGTKLAGVTFGNESASGWQEAYFDAPVPLTAGSTYVVSYFAPVGRYAVDGYWFTHKPTVSPPLTALRTGTDGFNGVYRYAAASTFPSLNGTGSNYWVDVIFATSVAVDATAPTVTGRNPAPGAIGVSTSIRPSATFSEGVIPASVAFTLRDAANAIVPATTSYDAASRTATVTPSSPLLADVSYTVRVEGATDAAGNVQAAPATWSFTTAADTPPGQCPCTIWSAANAPTTPPVVGTKALEVGLRFRASIDGSITGVRFFKGSGNTGTHVGALWTNSGALLASATFTAETADGWQQVNFATPIAVTAGTTYVVSTFSPTGVYAADQNYFASNGRTNGPLTALANGVDGLNGVYRYSTTPTAFPNLSYRASNYWVDVVFSTAAAPADTTPPSVSTSSPANGATEVAANSPVRASFNEAMTASSVSMSVTPAGEAAVAGTTAYDAGSRTATFTPAAPLAASATYTASVTATDIAGNPMSAPSTWLFTTAATPPPASECPCSVWTANDAPVTPAVAGRNPLEVGIRFRASVAGSVTGVRFYKGSGNSGANVASLWSNTGTLLARKAFAAESPTGWQQVTFDIPVAVTPGVTYVASYHSSSGVYMADQSYFATSGRSNGPLTALATGVDGPNGVYRYTATSAFPNSSYRASNYWVDVVFATSWA